MSVDRPIEGEALPYITPEFLDQSTFIGTLILAVVSIVWRFYRYKDLPSLPRFMTDIFNGAAVVPLMALVSGLFFPEIWSSVSGSNQLLVCLACLMSLFFVVRSIFTSDADREQASQRRSVHNSSNPNS